MCDIFLYFIRYSWSNFPSNAEMSARATESLFPLGIRMCYSEGIRYQFVKNIEDLGLNFMVYCNILEDYQAL